MLNVLFYINDKLVKEASIHFRNSWIDTFSITTPATDSLKLKYSIQKQNGYFDGEERSVPVFRPVCWKAMAFLEYCVAILHLRFEPLTDTGALKNLCGSIYIAGHGAGS